VKAAGVPLLLLLSLVAPAQDYMAPEADLSQLADLFFGYPDNDLNYEELYESLAQLLAHPVDINTASAESLRFFPMLRESQIQALLAYRVEHGALLSLYELQAVPGWELETTTLLLPFIRVYPLPVTLGGLARHLLEARSSTYLLMRYERGLETRKGFESAAHPFEGSADKTYIRFRSTRPNDFSVGFTAEKDAGERWAWRPADKRYGFDYWSAFLQIQHKGSLQNLVVGDYQAQFGQGLVLGGLFSMGKGAETITAVRRTSLGFMPYSSVNESGFLRGVAATYAITPHLQLSTFFSAVARDAGLTADTADNVITSLQLTGLHRTDTELASRKKVSERSYGAVLQYRRGRFDAGVVYHRLQLGAPLEKRVLPYNQFSFRGDRNDNASVFANYYLQNLVFFHEMAMTLGHGGGWVSGVLASLSPRLDAALLYRRYSRNFQTFSTGAFAESASPQNESGVYWGWKYRISRVYGLSGYIDIFSFPWLRYRSYTPAQGYEWMLRASFQPAKKIAAFAQLREEQKTRNAAPAPSTLYQPAPGVKRSYVVQLDYTVHPLLRLKTRAQFSTYTLAGRHTRGMAMLQDALFNLGKLGIALRYALFDTEDYDNRQYAYENDAWLAYSFPVYDGRGTRNYVLLDYPITPKLTVWVRYAHTRYLDREEIGSGQDAIPGNQRNDVKFQLRFKL
jgi:hypothetical protein